MYFRRSQRIAVDLTLIPDYGQAYQDKAEIRRGRPKSETTHFHAYATAYVAQNGLRYTLAMIYVSIRRGQGVFVRDELFRLGELLLWLAHLGEE